MPEPVPGLAPTSRRGAARRKAARLVGHGDIPVTRGLYGDGIDCRPWCAMQLTREQLRILQDIHATKPVTEEEANWAVRANYAAQGEDGDIALTPQGIRLIDEAK